MSVNPSGTVGFLGNAGQHLLFYDARTLDERGRLSTLRFDGSDTSIRGTTHLLWLDDTHFVAPIGDFFYRFDLDALERGERMFRHHLKLPHAIKKSASGRYACYGSMDHPVRGEAREVGVWDRETDEVTRIELPATCWHLVAHPEKDLFYAVSFRVLPQNERDYHQWAMAFFKEYVFEIDPVAGRVRRHWATGRETPAHLNSDVTISRREVIFCNGASQTVVLVDLDSMTNMRLIDERPGLRENLRGGRQIGTQIYDVLARGGMFTSTRDLFAALRVSRFTLMDSLHACQLSHDESLLFTANRGLNHITVYDYPSLRLRLRARMPDLHEFHNMPWHADPRLGFHHGFLVNPAGAHPAGANPAGSPD